MKVVVVNGSPRKCGNTTLLMDELREAFRSEGVEMEELRIGLKNIRGCMACYKCADMMNQTCVYKDDVNGAIQTLQQADGIVLAAPVYFAGMPGTMKSFLDRVFLVSAINGNLFRHKVGGVFTTLRRSGATATLDSLYHYLTFGEMIVATGNYWVAGHGEQPGEVKEDREGIQSLRLMAKNMAWILKMKAATAATLIPPTAEEKAWTNFVR